MENSLTVSSGLLLGLAAGMAPGPLMTLVISQALSYGIKEGAKTAMAPVISDLPIILAAFFLVSFLKANSWLMGVLSCVGALFILHLAFHSFTAKPGEPVAEADSHSWRKGILVNFLNPHPYLFWLSVGTPFLVKAWVLSPIKALMWVLGFYAALVGSKVLLALLAGKSRAFLNPRLLMWINRCLAVLLVAFAVLLARDAWRFLT